MSQSARRVAIEALIALESGAAERLDAVLSFRGMAKRERDLALELARGVERMWILLDHVLSLFVDRGLPTRPETRSALRLGVYQLLFLGRVPARAAVFETVALVGKDRGFVNAVLRKVAGAIRVVDQGALTVPATERLLLPDDRLLRLERPGLPDPVIDPAGRIALEHGLPGFLVERWVKAYGLEAATAAARASSRPPQVVLRVHRLRADAEALSSRLAAEGVETVPGPHPEVILWTGGSSPFETGTFHDGWFVAQDATAFRAAEAVGALPGETVLDLCAAPGTKTTALAAAVAPHGKVLAFDRDVARRGRILQNVDRLSLREQVTVVLDLDAVVAVDRVLADVPCSNTGVLSRRLEVRRRLRESTFAELAKTQRSLLALAFQKVRAGGVVVYSTCSIEPEENQQVVSAALSDACRLVRQELTLPTSGTCDGGFHAVFEVVDPVLAAATLRD